MKLVLHVNGTDRPVDVDEDTPLLWVLRDVLGMMGTKFGCGAGLCGACTVHVDGQAAFACQTPVGSLGDSKVTTIEALPQDRIGRAVQQAWIDADVVQCGYCQPGQMMRASAFLADNPAPTDADIDGGMATNICRCGTYTRIRAAIHQAAKDLAS